MRHVRIVFPFLNHKEMDGVQVSGCLALLSSVTLVKSLNLSGLRKWSILALATTYENRQKPYKIRTVKAFWLLSNFMARKKKNTDLLRLQASL